MQKPYEGHEIAYQKMRENGIRSWGERTLIDGRGSEIDIDDKRFLQEVLTQPWAPKKGKAVELGCGTAPLLRWICRKDFSGLGVDVSRTAIAMAKEQSQGLNLSFKCADLCKSIVTEIGTCDLCIDGHCFHCIISDADRRAFLKNVYNLLSPNGIFVVMTMCGPVDRRNFAVRFPCQRVVKEIIYSSYEKAIKFEGACQILGKPYMPTRRVPHWRSVLKELKGAGFHLQMIQFNHFTEKEPCSSLNLVGIKRENG
jgi:SAM-dependent methyltransferase